ncbi:MAG: malonyl-CoA synthase, partial [Proteobacteria bacterium]|nr:malonyl-CoA synthase [Pseudomonadota bacterium]
MNNNFYALLAGRFLPHADRLCLETPAGERYTYGVLDYESARYAQMLGALGLKRGDRVAVQIEKSPAALFFYLGCLRAGLIYVPLNTAYRDLELEHFLDDAEPALVVCSPERLDALRTLTAARGSAALHTLDAAGRGSLSEAARACNPRADVEAVGADDIAVILYTSGTTGRPKGA